MTRRELAAAAVALAVGAGVYVAWGRGVPPAPEERIRRHVVEMARAAEAREPGGVLERLSARFSGPELGDKDAVRGLVTGLLLRGEWVRAWPVDVQVALSGPAAAHVSLKVVLGRSTASRLEELGRDASLSGYRFETDWVLESDGGWRIVSATPRELSPAELLAP